MQYILNSDIKLNQHTVITEAEFERELFDEAIKDINIIVFVVGNCSNCCRNCQCKILIKTSKKESKVDRQLNRITVYQRNRTDLNLVCEMRSLSCVRYNLNRPL